MRRFLLLAAIVMMPGCSSGPKYVILEDIGSQPDMRVGVLEQRECMFTCTEADNPRLYSETLRARLEARLRRPVVLVSLPANFDWSGDNLLEKTVEAGKTAGVDYIVGGRLGSYKDPSTAQRAGKVALSVLTAPLGVISYYKPSVSAYIKIIRVADGKIVGTYEPGEQGGNFSKCTSMVENIADVIAENQFKAN